MGPGQLGRIGSCVQCLGERRMSRRIDMASTTSGTLHIDRHPGIAERLMDEKGEVRRFVNIYLNEEDIRFLDNQATVIKDGDEISIIPAIAGG